MIYSRAVLDPLSAEDERALALSWREREDEAALARLTSSHMALAFRVALDYQNSGAPLEDLVQEAMAGLVVACRRFDPDRGARLATYARYWIRCAVLEFIFRSRGSVQMGGSRAARKVFFGGRRALHRLGPEAGAPELAAALGIREEDARALLPRVLGPGDVPLDAVRVDRGPAEVAAPGEGAEERLAEADEVERQRAIFRRALSGLDPRSRRVVEARHLLEPPAKLRELADDLGLSKQRVQQIEREALRRLTRICRREAA